MRAKHRWLIQSIGVWPSGKAADFGSAIPGSNPGTPAFTQCGGAFLTDRDTSTALPASPSGVGYKGGQRLLPRLHVGGLRRYIDEKAGSPVLAAGKGTRMRSRLPKVLHSLVGRPLLDYALAAIEGATPGAQTSEPGEGQDGPIPIVVVASPESHAMRATFDGRCRFAIQPEQLGTADAVLAAQATLASLSPAPSHVLILPGDAPLLTAQTLLALLTAASQSASPLALITAQAPNPTGYGRVVRDQQGQVSAIIEEKNASPQQRVITEVNSSIYCISVDWLWEYLPHVQRNPVK